jgi:hypothetical protein
MCSNIIMISRTQFYIIALVVSTVVILYMYITSEYDHNLEINKIEQLEKREFEKHRKIDMARSQSVSCPIVGLDDARKCYFESEYNCMWSEEAQRCNKK